MLYTIVIPSKDYKAIEQYLKKGRVLMPEIIGRVYEGQGGVTAEILASQQAIKYSAPDARDVIIKSTVCHFNDAGVTVAFEIDSSYD